MPALTATAEEQRDGRLGPATLAGLAADFHAQGYCVLGGVLPGSTLDRLAGKLDLLAAQQGATRVLRQPPEQRGWHLNAGMPRTAAYFDDSTIVANPLLEQAVAELLGPK